MKKTVLLGSGGHASVVLEILKKYKNVEIIGFTDVKYSNDEKQIYNLYPILGTDDILNELIKNKKVEYAFITVGSVVDNSVRKSLFNKIMYLGYKSFNIIDESSLIANNVRFGEGNLVSPRVIINPGVIIGNNNIINTGAIVEHDCNIGDHIHIAPGTVLAGNVSIGNLTHIGLGAKVIEGISIGENCLVGAGAIIIKDIPDNSVVVGNPGKIIRER